MEILTIETACDEVLIAKMLSSGLIKLAIYNNDSDVNAIFLDKDKSQELVDFITRNVK